MRALVTAGGTYEPIDDVRGLTNRSTGRFGTAIAAALAARGVSTRALLGPLPYERLRDRECAFRIEPFSSAADLRERVFAAIESDRPDLVFMAAAVSDYRPARRPGKIPSDRDRLRLDLERTAKILPELRDRAGERAIIAGFKLLSGVTRDDLVAAARRQIEIAGTDLCVANDEARLDRERGLHPVILVSRDGSVEEVEGARENVAERVVERALSVGRM